MNIKQRIARTEMIWNPNIDISMTSTSVIHLFAETVGYPLVRLILFFLIFGDSKLLNMTENIGTQRVNMNNYLKFQNDNLNEH